MIDIALRRVCLLLGLVAGIVAWGAASAVALNGLDGYDSIFGRYAPGGDCKRQPRVIVDASGIVFEIGGETEKVTNPEEALGYFGPDYTGIAKVIFPFRSQGSYPIMMSFNDSEKPGVLVIAGHDEGWPGGPTLSPRNQELVDGSPYARCE